MAKFVAITLLALFLTVANAAVSITTYSDSSCANATSFYQSSDECYTKINTDECTGDGPWFLYHECSTDQAQPSTLVPEGWPYVTFYLEKDDCNFTSVFQRVAAMSYGRFNTLFDYNNGIFFNVTLLCNATGEMAFSFCQDASCTGWNSIVANQCTISSYDAVPAYSYAVQDSCMVAPPVAPPTDAPAAEPAAMPVSAPVSSPVEAPVKSNSPVKKTSDAVSIVGSALFVIASATMMLC